MNNRQEKILLTLKQTRKENTDYFELLQLSVESGILTLDEASERSTMKKGQILKEHEEHHKIFLASDGRWKTHLPDGNGKGKLVAKKNRKDLEDAVVNFYLEQKESAEVHTFRTLYPKFIKQKQELEKLADASIARYQNSWDLLLKVDAPIVDFDITKLTRGQYKNWAMEFLRDYPMRKKSFDNVRTVLNGIITYAADQDYIRDTSMKSFTLPQTCYLEEDESKPDPRKEPFNDEELDKLVPILWETYESRPSYTVPLAILFMFYVPVRPDEEEALRFSDMDSEHYLHVARHQAKAFDDGTKLTEMEIKNSVKSQSRKKPVYVSEEARYILNLVRKANAENGDVNDDYIFYNNHRHLTTAAINRCLDTACKKAGIPSRCIYMVRKTYASVLADDKDVPETLISDSMGHRDFKVTRKHYIKGRTVKSAEAAVIEHALNAKIPSHKSVTPSNTNSGKRKAPETA